MEPDQAPCVVEHYPVDLPLDYDTLRTSAENYLSCLELNSNRENYFFLFPSGEKMKVTQDSVCHLSLFGDDDPACVVLALLMPEDQSRGEGPVRRAAQLCSVVALFLDGKWWAPNNILKTSNSARSGLMLVESAGERVVLFVLSQIIFGTLERPISEATYFSPHPEKETGKILWVSGEAVGFYTIKQKGSLCDKHTVQCYLLPVLDTIFVRSSRRRQGFALRMLGDFCSSFSKERVLGISYPVSSDMYQDSWIADTTKGIKGIVFHTGLKLGVALNLEQQRIKVCRKYLGAHETDRDCLYEVEAPGEWSQRRNVWLTLQLGCNPSRR